MRIVDNDELRFNLMVCDKTAGHETMNAGDAMETANLLSVACRLAANYLEIHGNMVPTLRTRLEKMSDHLYNGLEEMGYYDWR